MSGRVLDAARRAQGFRTQAHLDAFGAWVDHLRACTDCAPSAMPLDDGWQPAVGACAAAVRLMQAFDEQGRRP